MCFDFFLPFVAVAIVSCLFICSDYLICCFSLCISDCVPGVSLQVRLASPVRYVTFLIIYVFLLSMYASDFFPFDCGIGWMM